MLRLILLASLAVEAFAGTVKTYPLDDFAYIHNGSTVTLYFDSSALTGQATQVAFKFFYLADESVQYSNPVIPAGSSIVASSIGPTPGFPKGVWLWEVTVASIPESFWTASSISFGIATPALDGGIWLYPYATGDSVACLLSNETSRADGCGSMAHYSVDNNVTPTPEPSGLSFFVLSAIALAFATSRRRGKHH